MIDGCELNVIIWYRTDHGDIWVWRKLRGANEAVNRGMVVPESTWQMSLEWTIDADMKIQVVELGFYV